jgi:hypothetical protein|tara:strand:+ start:191 stop:529 length:339 start_codon:yes stop_codon:yes gene_type:complete
MSNLSTKIKIYAANNGVSEIDFTKDVLIQDDMISGVSNPYIREWNLDIAQPTDAQLAAVENDADKEEANQIVIANRKSAYGSPEDQIQNIVEKGLEFEQNRVAEIKAANPKQ